MTRRRKQKVEREEVRDVVGSRKGIRSRVRREM
jgi:hypothetical protein